MFRAANRDIAIAPRWSRWPYAGEHDVRERFQFEFVREIAIDFRLAFEHVERRPRDAFRLERAQRRLFVHDRPARRIDHEAVFFMSANCSVDIKCRVEGEAACSVTKSATCRSASSARRFAPNSFSNSLFGFMSAIHAFHLESLHRAFRHRLADAAEPDDAKRLAVYVRSKQ